MVLGFGRGKSVPSRGAARAPAGPNVRALSDLCLRSGDLVEARSGFFSGDLRRAPLRFRLRLDVPLEEAFSPSVGRSSRVIRGASRWLEDLALAEALMRACESLAVMASLFLFSAHGGQCSG